MDEFDEYRKEKDEQSHFFKAQNGVKYDLVIGSFKLGKKAFEQGGTEKWNLEIRLLSINGKATEKIWNTSANNIIEALEPYKGRFDELANLVWRAKRIDENNKTKWIFEDIGRVKLSPSDPED